MYCGKCGASIPDDAQFCSECGFKTNNSKSQNDSIYDELNGQRTGVDGQRPKALFSGVFGYIVGFVITLIIIGCIKAAFSYFFIPFYLEKSFKIELDDMHIDYEIVETDYDRNDKELTVIIVTDNAKYKAKVEPLGKTKIEYSIRQTKRYNDKKAIIEWEEMKEEIDEKD